MKVLFLCTENSCRSQMAEAIAKHFHSDVFDAYSAGVRPKFVNPLAKKVLEEWGINASYLRSKSLKEFEDQTFDLVITLCDSAKEECPFFPGAKKMIHRGFPDPSKATGTEEEILNTFRKVRDEIKSFIDELADKYRPQSRS
ncbi:arsenate reductase [Thermosulfidibacter takaii ABI70S6]|uniref:Arsenate reductase n=1 Tax=Thermosulfidibacter takaii (strain DSM 17441 / JCM 13301 / NBRC 103674 / ABI70S6) TaxID=1298851 RepID=A0A0S3QVP2_THET7|nr:arsenate reductase ArsC [Thermosulfidibacter takaii]BAT72398.1 arsenate reductase [Thermosulfidibacter takaii ABI70S6]